MSSQPVTTLTPGQPYNGPGSPAQPYAVHPGPMLEPPAPPLPPSPSDALAAQGQPVRLIDGATVFLRYSMASLRVLEARFGSLRGIEVEMKGAADALKSDDPKDAKRGAIFTVLSDALAPGFLHVRVQHPDTLATVRLGADQDLVMEQLDPGQLQNYVTAFGKALGQAFGTEGKAVGEAVATTASPSPGPSGTTPPVSSPGAATDSSGA